MTDEEIDKYHFEELIKILVILTLPAAEQKYVMGFGAIADEMAMDFDSYYTLAKIKYIERKWLSKEQEYALDEIDQYFNERSGDKNPDFWNDETLGENPEWEDLRKKVKKILTMLGKDNLGIKVERKVEYTKSDNGESLAVERTVTQLINK